MEVRLDTQALLRLRGPERSQTHRHLTLEVAQGPREDVQGSDT